MKCEELGALLDTRAADALTAGQKRDVDRHLASCGECRAAWKAYGDLTAERIPPPARDLSLRIAAAIAARPTPRASRLGRAAVVGSLVVAGAAAAALVLQFGGTPPPPEQPDKEAPTTARPAAGSPNTPVPAATNDDSRTTIAAASGVAPPSADYPLDPYSIVVLAMPGPDVDGAGVEAFDRCHAEVVRELGAAAVLNPIAGARVAPYAGSTMPAEQIARALGAGSALVLTTADSATIDRIVASRASLGLTSRVGSCVAQQLDALTGNVRVDFMSIRPDWLPEHWRSFAVEVVERIGAASLANAEAAIAEARAKVLDAALEDAERAAALAQLRRGAEYSEPIAMSAVPVPRPLVQLHASVEPVSAAFDDALVAAIVQLGSASPIVRARESAWRHARGVRHPLLVDGLITSLGRDAHPNVRRAAAFALGYLVDEPGVRAALARAAEQDPDDEAPIPCCVPSVRGAALRALSPEDAIRAAALSTVLDASLPGEERLRPLTDSVDGRAFPLELDAAAARAVFAVGSSTDDALLRSRAWNGLREIRDDDFMRTLLADLNGHPSELVRTAAAGALRLYADDGAVRAALEQAAEAPFPGLRRAALEALRH